MADLTVEVNAPTVVTYGVPPSMDDWSCGDAESTNHRCSTAVPLNAAVSFAAPPLPAGSATATWRGDCVADPDDPWRAHLASALPGSRCRLDIEREEPLPCDLERPVIEIEGAETLSNGQFARVRSADDQPRVNVLARGMLDGSFYLEPARFEWTEYSLDPEGFFPVGSTPTLTDHTLNCSLGAEHCLLRLLVEDRCGTRVAELPYFIVRPRPT